MPRVSPLQSDFSGGEFSPLMYGRVDFQRYKTGLAVCKNYLPTLQGGLIRRPGTIFVSEVKDSTKFTRLIPFEFSTVQAYMIEFGNGYCRFFKNQALITLAPTTISGATQANPCVITDTAHGYSNGDRVVISGILGMVQLNNREFIVQNVTANTYSLQDTTGTAVNSTGYTAYTSGGQAEKIYEIVSPYGTADLPNIVYTQSDDILYLVHPSYAPRQLTRTGNTSWTMSTITFSDGPYKAENTTATTLTPSATTGSITITASVSTFVSTDVGRMVRMQHGTTWGWATITAYTSGTSVTATVGSAFGAITAVTTWELGLWSATDGYPSVVIFHQDRLVFGGAGAEPQRLDASRTADYTNFSPTDSSGNVVDSHALAFSLNANDVNQLVWLASDQNGLQAGSIGGEWIIQASTQGIALTPTNINANRSSSYGSASVQPVQVGKAVLFVQRHNRKLRENMFFWQVNGYLAQDMTILSEHITASGIQSLAYQRELNSVVWARRTDGTLIGMTYDRSLEGVKAGWHRHQLGGQSDLAGSPPIVDSIQCIPSADGTYDEVWLSVQRYINGRLVRYIEIIDKMFEVTDQQKDAFFVDAGLTYDNPITITGATKASPVVITANGHGFSNGDAVLVSDVLGMTDLNTNTYYVAGATTNTFQLQDSAGNNIDGTAFGTYVSGGSVRKYVTNISGLFHLEGQSVSLLADGATQPNVTVSGGQITLSQRATTVHIGFSYQSDIQILRVEAGSAEGVALGKTRRIHRLGVLLYRSLGLKIGPSFDNLTELTFRKTSDKLTRAVSLFSGIRSELVETDYDFDNQICLRQDEPLPSMILAIAPLMETQDRG